MSEANNCKLGCEIIRNFTLYTCPGIDITFDPDAYALVAGLPACDDQCSYNPGTWWHFTNFESYFTCFRKYELTCDYWEIYRNCSPMQDELLFGLQMVSFVCCIGLVFGLRKEVHKGMLQQSLFISISHSLVQALMSEQFYNIWVMYLLPVGWGRSILALTLRFAHVWIAFGALVWSLITAVVLLRITEGQQRCMSLIASFQRHKTKIIVCFEGTIMLMSAISVVARLKVWNNFFLAFLIVCLVAVLAGVVCYSVPAIRARRMQKRLAESQSRRRVSDATQKAAVELRARQRSPELRIQLRPFLLLLAVLLFTYVPFLVVYSQPVSMRTRTGYLTAWAFLELVGFWNFLGLLVVYFGRGHMGSNMMRVWCKNERLVGRGNLAVVGVHGFVRKHHQPFYKINTEPTVFGASCTSPDDSEYELAGDVEQSPKGLLVRWTKRPSRYTHNSICAAGLPLEKFQLFVDPSLYSWFPHDALVPLPSGTGFSFAVNIQDADQRLQVQAVDEYEDASTRWKGLHDDRSSPPEEPINQFEQAQLNWAYEEAVLKLKACIEVLVRWRRSPTSVTDPSNSSSPLSDVTLTVNSNRVEKKLWHERNSYDHGVIRDSNLILEPVSVVTFTRKDEHTESEERVKSETIDTQLVLFT